MDMIVLNPLPPDDFHPQHSISLDGNHGLCRDSCTSEVPSSHHRERRGKW